MFPRVTRIRGSPYPRVFPRLYPQVPTGVPYSWTSLVVRTHSHGDMDDNGEYAGFRRWVLVETEHTVHRWLDVYKEDAFASFGSASQYAL